MELKILTQGEIRNIIGEDIYKKVSDACSNLKDVELQEELQKLFAPFNHRFDYIIRDWCKENDCTDLCIVEKNQELVKVIVENRGEPDLIAQDIIDDNNIQSKS
jgi:hypothetical protein